MTCQRCHGLVIVVQELLDTYETEILRCISCGNRIYPCDQPPPMRHVEMGRRGKRIA